VLAQKVIEHRIVRKWNLSFLCSPLQAQASTQLSHGFCAGEKTCKHARLWSTKSAGQSQ